MRITFEIDSTPEAIAKAVVLACDYLDLSLDHEDPEQADARLLLETVAAALSEQS
jgi:hypothetical protein